MTIRRTKKVRAKRTFNPQKVKTIFFVHARYACIQCILTLGAYLARNEISREPFQFFLISLSVCGFFAFPQWTTRNIANVVRQNEYTGMWGNWILQSVICLGCIRFIIPFEESSGWKHSLIAVFFLSILLLLLSAKRTRLKLQKLHRT